MQRSPAYLLPRITSARRRTRFDLPRRSQHCPRPLCTLHTRHFPPPRQAVSSGLGQQRAVFEGIGGKMSSLGAKFPVVNTLLNAVRRRRNRVRRSARGVT